MYGGGLGQRKTAPTVLDTNVIRGQGLVAAHSVERETVAVEEVAELGEVTVTKHTHIGTTLSTVFIVIENDRKQL